MGSTAPPFSIAGLASGLDTNAIIDKLVALYSAPMQINIQQQSVDTQKQAAWSDIQTQMNALQTAIQNLQAPTAVAGRLGTVTPPAGQTSAPFTMTATPTAALGSFTVNVIRLATNGSLTSGSSISAPITTTQGTTTPLVSLGLGTPLTSGTVTINGVQIAIDASTTLMGAGADTLQTKLTAAGVTLSTTTSGSNIIGLTLTANTANVPLQLGVSGDTSNLLSALKLATSTQSQAGGIWSISSNGSLNGVNISAPLSSANLATTLTGTSGSFTVNGAAINYGPTDSIGSVMGMINSSAAGVTANYDPLSDKMTLTSTSTGMGGISVADVSGNLAAALGLTTGASAVSNPGLPAEMSISNVNGGANVYSASNTVAGLEPGVTLNLTSASTGGASTVNIAPDTTSLTNALQSFVTAYNSVQDTVTKYTAIQVDSSGTPQAAGILAGDPSLSDLTTQLDQIVNDTSVTVGGNSYSMAALGIRTGPPGSCTPGTSPNMDLQFTPSDVASALTTAPSLAQAFIGNGNVSSQQGTLFQNLNNLVNSWTAPLGVIGTSLDTLSADYATQQTEIQNWQDQITAERAQLSTMFTNMESTVALLQSQQQALTAVLGSTTSPTTTSPISTSPTTTSSTASGTTTSGTTTGG